MRVFTVVCSNLKTYDTALLGVTQVMPTPTRHFDDKMDRFLAVLLP